MNCLRLSSNIIGRSVLYNKINPSRRRSNIRIGSSLILSEQSFSGYLSSSSLDKTVSNHKKFDRKLYYRDEVHELRNAFSETGAIAEMPKWYKLGLIKVLATIVTFMLVGSLISKTVVTFLEENDIFKPEDGDDDED
jgi:hypothetical protein